MKIIMKMKNENNVIIIMKIIIMKSKIMKMKWWK